MSWVNDNGGAVGLAVLGAAVIAGYIELRLPSDAELQTMVDNKFVAAGAVPPHRMDRAEEKITGLEAEDEKLDSKIERIVQILLEE